MPSYELLFILPGTLAENEVSPLVVKTKELIENNGGQGLTIETQDKRRLAYPIKQVRYGYFQLAYFNAKLDAIKIIEQKLAMLPELLRFFLKKRNPNSQAQKKINFIQAVGLEDYKKPVESFIKPQPAVNDMLAAEVNQISTESTAPVKKESARSKKEERKKINLDDIDKKLDEILDMDLDKV